MLNIDDSSDIDNNISKKGTKNKRVEKLYKYSSLAGRIRAHALEMTHRSKSAHIATCLSVADILAVLYGGLLRVDPENPEWSNRDRFILSKGHACAALYAVLAELSFFPRDWLQSYFQDDGKLFGHITSHGVPGVEVSSGSLGHGLPIGCGMALAAKKREQNYRVFVILSDGECDEGSTWESVLFAAQMKLDNLVAIIDYNKIQAFGKVEEVINLEPLAVKWKSFNWAVKEIDGHDYKELEDTLQNVPFESNKPNCVICHTIKGKGVSFMENELDWHYKWPNSEQLKQALLELGDSQ